MNKAMMAKLKAYLRENCVEPPLAHCRMNAGIGDEETAGDALPYAEPSLDYSKLERELPPLEDTFASQLLKLIHAKGKTEAAVYRKARIDRRLFSKIRTNKDYTPSKATILALIIALELDAEEAQDLLGRAGYNFSKSQKGDVIVHFFIGKRIYDARIITGALRHYGIKVPWEARSEV